MDTEKVCGRCGRRCVPAQSYCPKCGGALPAATPATPGSVPTRGSHKLILTKGAEKRSFECDDEAQALDQAVPWVMKGYTARIADEQGVVKWTQALSGGQIAVFEGDATARRAAPGPYAPGGQSLAPPKRPWWRFW